MPLYENVPGQDAAVAALRSTARSGAHAFLLVAPPGVGAEEAALSLAAQLVCPDGGCGTCRHCARAVAEQHPDVEFVRPEGSGIPIGKRPEDGGPEEGSARWLIQRAHLSPSEGRRHVIIVSEAHSMRAEAMSVFLKTLEEPPPSTSIVLIAERVAPQFSAVASRCSRIDFAPLTPAVIQSVLASEGIPALDAERAAESSGGRLDRARVLALDKTVEARRELWESALSRLNGTGAAVASVVADAQAAITDLTEPVAERMQADLKAETARAKDHGLRPESKKDAEARQKRVLRRITADEIRWGLTIMAEQARAVLSDPQRSRHAAEILQVIHETSAALDRNPHEGLLLMAAFSRLTPLAHAAGLTQKQPA